jgi:aarF domain-containing kinase
MLSIQDDNSISKEVTEILEKVRKSANIMPKKQLEKMLISEMGENWKKNFKEFDENPVAAASIGLILINI